MRNNYIFWDRNGIEVPHPKLAPLLFLLPIHIFFFKYYSNKYKNTTFFIISFIFALNSFFEKTNSIFTLNSSFEKRVYFLYWIRLLKRWVSFFTLKFFILNSPFQKMSSHFFILKSFFVKISSLLYWTHLFKRRVLLEI